MPGVLVDTLLVLRYPVSVRAAELGKTFHTYLATSRVNGHSFAFSVTSSVDQPNTPLLPHGTVAQVSGPLAHAGKALLVPATSVVGLYLATSRATRRDLEKLFEPVLTFSGKVSKVLPVDVSRPGVKEFDVTVDSEDAWPHRSTTIRCFWNRDERRFRATGQLRVGMSLHVVGVLMGWQDGLLAVDVHQIRPNGTGDLPGQALVTSPTLFERVGVMNDFAMFADQSSLPPRAGLPASLAKSDTASARWLDIVAGLPAGGEFGVTVPSKRPANDYDDESAGDSAASPRAGPSGTASTTARAMASHARGGRALRSLREAAVEA